IQNFDSGFGDQDIRGLEITMDNAPAVSCHESFQNLLCISQRFWERERTAKRRALNVLHHQVIRPDVIKSRDVRMIESRWRTGLVLNSIAELLLRDLQRDHAPQ